MIVMLETTEVHRLPAPTPENSRVPPIPQQEHLPACSATPLTETGSTCVSIRPDSIGCLLAMP